MSIAASPDALAFDDLPSLARASVPDHSTSYSQELALWRERMPGGFHWSGLLRRGNSLRITTHGPNANVSALFYNFEERSERYNMPDTLKGQSTAYLRKGLVCYSDMGRVLCSVADSSCTWHDTIGGISDAAQVDRQYGAKRYQEHRNAMHRNARDGFLTQLGKWGMGKRDLVPNVNFFSKVMVDEDGNMKLVPNHSVNGDFVDLRFEMNTIVVLSTCQHRLDPGPRYEPTAVELMCWRSGTAGKDDLCRLSMPENGRGFINTERYYL
ncbi:urea carboxylase-associated family protein [Pseudomonas extremaustralis]|uniref:urea amidolyase associated protein UAAP1 n=1 Tax=Pseudomonas extremaustralis TaxID=359110 RepID=UPI0024102C0E|nr:urea amidolyase associated protein UAAP1 [Pseudomonas extremaustralis]MDG2971199.1 urea carboxylase-associated family protein [Pseudomonas extremaustralis]